MRNKLIILSGGLILSIALLGLYFLPISPPPRTINMKIVKLNGVWKVINTTDTTQIEAKAKKKDTIVWTVVGTDADFQLPVQLFNPVSKDDSLHSGKVKFIKDGKQLKEKVKDDAASGTYIYSVFCIADSVYAIGGSPPKIIIE